MNENAIHIHFQPALILYTKKQPRNAFLGLPHAWGSSMKNLWYVATFFSHPRGGNKPEGMV